MAVQIEPMRRPARSRQLQTKNGARHPCNWAPALPHSNSENLRNVLRPSGTRAIITPRNDANDFVCRVARGCSQAREVQITGEFAMDKVSRRNSVRLVLAVAAALFATSLPSFATEEAVPLAIKGYDPVAYFTIGSPTRGLPEIAYEWDEHRYLFASAEHRELFKADPVRYAPQFGNFCAMALALGELDEANPENWLISDGKLYIFGKPAPMGPALFQQDLAANIAKANQNRALVQVH
jgi:hypothetical protein